MWRRSKVPTKRISFTNFNRRLVLAGGREQTGVGGLRRASGIAPETTTSVLSRWGSQQLYSIAAIQTYYWNGARYQYDGATLYKNGVSIKTGFNGARLTFNSMPPQEGSEDYLFILGGGATPFKIAPDGTISNWGIVNPPNQMTAAIVAADQIVIDSFVSSALNYTGVGTTTVANETTIVAVGAGSLKINPSGGAWSITQSYAAAQNWAYYSNNDFSLDTDVFQIWFYFDTFGSASGSPGTWLEIDVDLNDQSFKKDWYSVAVGLLPATTATPRVRHNVNFDVTFQTGQWQQLTIAKSQFLRNGADYQLDWSMVQGLRIKGGNFTGNLYLDNFTLSGGDEKGAGPAVGNGGSEYDYSIVYRNLTTGSQSNPNNDPVKVFNVQVNKIQLNNIPVSSDPQVGARDVYRTQALTQPGGGAAFYVDTIYDNVTTAYTDSFADYSVRLVTTPWAASIAVPPSTPTHTSTANYFIDAGNGYYFKLTTAGTTGSEPPVWSIPTSSWSANSAYVLNETVAPLKGNGNFFKCTVAGTSGLFQPNWASALSLGATIADGGVTWTNTGPQTVTDNTAAWTFQGINSTQVISNNELLYDNAPPLATYQDAYGPFQGSMFWTRDSAAGAEGYVYASPPGRPESVGEAYTIGSSNDTAQKVLAWDGALWALTQAKLFLFEGVYPALSPLSINDALGTNSPYTVLALQMIGIIYWAPDGIRVASRAGSRLIGFQQIAPILRGQAEENVAAWSPTNGPVWAALFRDEIVFSDGATLTLALAYDGVMDNFVWRQPGQILTAAYYEPQTGQIQAAFGGATYLFEEPGQLADGTAAIPFIMQSPGDMPDIGAQFTTQRIYISATLNNQTVTPTLIVDGTEYGLPPITANGSRVQIELSPKVCGRFFEGVRLNGSLTNRVEIFRIEADVWLGDENMP